jgi:hypothetical protein
MLAGDLYIADDPVFAAESRGGLWARRVSALSPMGTMKGRHGSLDDLGAGGHRCP